MGSKNNIVNIQTAVILYRRQLKMSFNMSQFGFLHENILIQLREQNPKYIVNSTFLSLQLNPNGDVSSPFIDFHFNN